VDVVQNPNSGFDTNYSSAGGTKPYRRFLPQGKHHTPLLNKTFYSFGGKTGIDNSAKQTKNHAYTHGSFNSQVENQRQQQTNFGTGRSSVPALKRSDIFKRCHENEGQHYIVKHNLERVNDYTKNESQSIFSPGMMPATRASSAQRK